MIKHNKATELFFIIDEFDKKFEENGQKKIGKPRPLCKMSDSEVMTILIAFRVSPYKQFKYFYLHQVLENWKNLFPKALSYNRFLELNKSH